MAKNQWGPDRKLARMMLLGMLLLAGLGTLVAVAGCQSTPPKNPTDVWIEQHPYHYDEKGNCIEADGEPCDADPYDLDDMYEADHKTPGAAKTSGKPKVSSPKASPKPATTKRR